MSPTGTCDNPTCTCVPCTCAQCACGVVRLGALERKVMGVLWAAPGRELTGRDVVDAVGGNAYTTIATVLDRLVRKELVRRRTVGRTIHFTAAGTPASHAAALMHDELNTARDPDAVLARFVQTASRSEAETLRRALVARRRATSSPD